jgi:hypothetical protein
MFGLQRSQLAGDERVDLDQELVVFWRNGLNSRQL